jgi:small nuclear ribonucleoprotein (snRNP)-like protein
MIRRNGKSALAARVAVVILLPVLALAQGDKIGDAEKIRAKTDMLSSRSVTVSVELKDGRSYKGRITDVQDEHFTLTEPEAGLEIRIRYESVAKLRKRGMIRGAKTAMWIGVAAGIGALVILGPRGGAIDTICPLSCRK